MPTPTPSTQLQDLPVAVCLPDPLGREVRAWLEGELGWQVVPPGGPPRPVLELRHRDEVTSGCVVVSDGAADAPALRAALDAGARDVVGWPDERDRLPGIALRSAAAPGGEGPPVWRIAGTGGGVGTSTVALAVAGLAAWAGRRVVVTGGEGLLDLCGVGPWSGPGLAEVGAIDPADRAAEITALARPVAGLDGLAVLGGVVPEHLDVSSWPATLVVVDGGVAGGGPADLLVTAPDARAARARNSDAPLLVVGDGPLDERGVRTRAGRAPVGWLPPSARVARAALRGRVPVDLPGTWLRSLRDALRRARG